MAVIGLSRPILDTWVKPAYDWLYCEASPHEGRHRLFHGE
jgi:hypothetical protein